MLGLGWMSSSCLWLVERPVQLHHPQSNCHLIPFLYLPDYESSRLTIQLYTYVYGFSIRLWIGVYGLPGDHIVHLPAVGGDIKDTAPSMSSHLETFQHPK